MKFIAAILFFCLATASAEGGAEKLSHTRSFLLPRGGTLRLNCPVGKSIVVNVNKKKVNDLLDVELGNIDGCTEWMPEHADRVDYVVEKHLLPLNDFKTPVVEDVIIVVPEDHNDHVFIIYGKF